MPDARMATIYALCDPKTGVVRYVGKTFRTPEQRLYFHVWHAKRGAPGHKNAWIRSVGLAPSIVVLNVVPIESAASAEMEFIAHYRGLGFDLTNSTDGGDGTYGYKHSEQTIGKIKAALVGRRGRKLTQQEIEGLVARNKSRVWTAEQRAKVSAARRLACSRS